MSGTNIFAHASDEAKYVILEPFTRPGAAFEAGGNVQELLEQIDISAVTAIPEMPIATTSDYGIVKYADNGEATGLTDPSPNITPLSLDAVNTFVSPATNAQRGNLLEIQIGELDRDYATSSNEKLMSYRRISDFGTVRVPLEDDGDTAGVGGDPTRSGLFRFASWSESVGHSNLYAISPVRSWNLIKTEIPDPWLQATETEEGVARGVSSSDSFASDKSIQFTNYALDTVKATTTKKGVFRLWNGTEDDDSNEVIVTPATVDQHLATLDKIGFFTLSSGIVNDPSVVATAADGYVLDDLIGSSGGTITGTLQCDDISTTRTVRVKVWYGPSYNRRYYYANKTFTSNMFDGNNMLDPQVGIGGRPIGSVFKTTGSTNPNNYFGGVWYRVSGRTTLGAGTGTDTKGRRRSFSSGSTGGQARVTLQEKHLPQHKHLSWGEKYTGRKTSCKRSVSYPWFFGGIEICLEYNYDSFWRWGHGGSRNNQGMGSTDYDNYLYYSEPVGGGQSHENMMPYKVVNIWRRVK